MAYKFIRFGDLNRKHFLPFLLGISNLVNQLIIKYYPEKDHRVNTALDLYATSLGFISIMFIPLIFKIGQRDIPKEKEIQKRKCLHFFALVGTYIIYMAGKAIPNFLRGQLNTGDMKVSNPFSEGPFTYVGVDMIFLTVATFIVFKNKYYIHHIISIIGFIIFGNISDIFLDYYPEMYKAGVWFNIIMFVSLILDSIFLCTQKYLLEKLYYPYWKINLTLGITLFTFATIALIIYLACKNTTLSSSPMIYMFYKYFEDNNAGIIIGKFLLFTVTNFISSTLSIINIYYFNPTFFLINFIFSKFVLGLIDKRESKKFFCIIFFLLQTFSLMVYLEIIELEFLGLNKNTKRNIELRGIEDISGENGRDSSIGVKDSIDINDDYYIDSLGKDKEPFIEMSPKSNEEEQSSPP